MKIRCQDCKHAFDEPEDENGVTPAPTDSVRCPGCGEYHKRLWYIELQSLDEFEAFGIVESLKRIFGEDNGLDKSISDER